MLELFKDFVLIMFGFFIAFLLPELSKIEIANSPLVTFFKVIILLFCGFLFLFLLYQLGKAIDEKRNKEQDEQNKNLVKDILRELGYGGDEYYANRDTKPKQLNVHIAKLKLS